MRELCKPNETRGGVGIGAQTASRDSAMGKGMGICGDEFQEFRRDELQHRHVLRNQGQVSPIRRSNG